MLDPTPLARGLGAQEGRGGELPRRPVRGSVQRNAAVVPRCSTRSRRCEPGTIVENKRLGAALALVKAAAGGLSRRISVAGPRAAATAEQSGGAGFAVEGSATTRYGRGCSGLRKPRPDLADAGVVLTALKTASRAPSAVVLASLGPVLTATARDARQSQVGTEKRRLDRTKKLQPATRSIARQHKARRLVGRVRLKCGCHLYFARRVTFQPCADNECRPNVQMSVPSNLKMSVSPAFWWAVGGGIDDGAERERWRAAASRGVARRRSWRSAGACCCAAVGA